MSSELFDPCPGGLDCVCDECWELIASDEEAA